jgi:sulfotransferase family protein
MTRMPDLFIVGAPKSGTTSLYEYLKGHPDVFMSVVKEPCYFARDLAKDDSGNFLVYGRDEKLFLDLFADAGDAKRLGEASTRYLYSKDAPTLIHDAQPDARIVAMLRNPVDMIHSLHAHKLAAATEDVADFEQALATEADRHAGRRIPAHSNPGLATYRDRARFGEQLPRWFEAFGRDRVHVIIFEDMIRDTEGEFRRLLEFLEIDPDYQPESFGAHNTAHGARSIFVRRLLNSRPPQWFVWTFLPRVIGDVRTRGLVRRFRHSWFHRRKIQKAPLSSELRRRLEEEFAPDVARLSEMLGRDLGELWFGRSVTAPPASEKQALAAS